MTTTQEAVNAALKALERTRGYYTLVPEDYMVTLPKSALEELVRVAQNPATVPSLQELMESAKVGSIVRHKSNPASAYVKIDNLWYKLREGPTVSDRGFEPKDFSNSYKLEAR